MRNKEYISQPKYDLKPIAQFLSCTSVDSRENTFSGRSLDAQSLNSILPVYSDNYSHSQLVPFHLAQTEKYSSQRQGDYIALFLGKTVFILNFTQFELCCSYEFPSLILSLSLANNDDLQFYLLVETELAYFTFLLCDVDGCLNVVDSFSPKFIHQTSIDSDSQVFIGDEIAELNKDKLSIRDPLLIDSVIMTIDVSKHSSIISVHSRKKVILIVCLEQNSYCIYLKYKFGKDQESNFNWVNEAKFFPSEIAKIELSGLQIDQTLKFTEVTVNLSALVHNVYSRQYSDSGFRISKNTSGCLYFVGEDKVYLLRLHSKVNLAVLKDGLDEIELNYNNIRKIELVSGIYDLSPKELTGFDLQNKVNKAKLLLLFGKWNIEKLFELTEEKQVWNVVESFLRERREASKLVAWEALKQGISVESAKRIENIRFSGKEDTPLVEVDKMDFGVESCSVGLSVSRVNGGLVAESDEVLSVVLGTCYSAGFLRGKEVNEIELATEEEYSAMLRGNIDLETEFGFKCATVFACLFGTDLDLKVIEKEIELIEDVEVKMWFTETKKTLKNNVDLSFMIKNSRIFSNNWDLTKHYKMKYSNEFGEKVVKSKDLSRLKENSLHPLERDFLTLLLEINN